MGNTNHGKDDIFEKIAFYLEDYFEIDKNKITLDSHFYTELDLDSIDAVDLIVKLQEMCNKKISPHEFKEVRTVRDVVDLIYRVMHDDTGQHEKF